MSDHEADDVQASVVTVPSGATEGEGSATSIDESAVLAIANSTKSAATANIKNSGNMVPLAFDWSVDDVAQWVEDIGFWQYKVHSVQCRLCLMSEKN